MKKGVIYSGTFMGGIPERGGPHLAVSDIQAFPCHPLAIAMTLGAMAFPLLKTIVETFDGSRGVFRPDSNELSKSDALRPRDGGWNGDGIRHHAVFSPCRPIRSAPWFGFV